MHIKIINNIIIVDDYKITKVIKLGGCWSFEYIHNFLSKFNLLIPECEVIELFLHLY